MDNPVGDNGLVEKGRIRMEISSFLMERRSVFDAISKDVSVQPEDIPLIIEHVKDRCEIEVSSSPQTPRHGWKVSALADFIHKNQQPNASTTSP